MNRLLYSALLLIFFSCTPNVQEIQLDQFKVTIPASFKQLAVNTEKDEVLKLNYKDELYIIVQDNIGHIIKENQNGVVDAFTFIQKLKFNALQSAYEGYNPSGITTDEINGHPFISQVFYSNEETGKVYYEYRIMKVGENYFEFITSGEAEAQEKHMTLINNFYSSIELV